MSSFHLRQNHLWKMSSMLCKHAPLLVSVVDCSRITSKTVSDVGGADPDSGTGDWLVAV